MAENQLRKESFLENGPEIEVFQKIYLYIFFSNL